jgi:hypothetical protein
MKYHIEYKSTTFRSYVVEADDPDEALREAEVQLAGDEEVSKVWKENADVIYVASDEEHLNMPF